MYKCDDCREIFEEPDTIEQFTGEFWGMPAYEKWSCCPNCKSTDIEEYIDYEEEEDY